VALCAFFYDAAQTTAGSDIPLPSAISKSIQYSAPPASVSGVPSRALSPRGAQFPVVPLIVSDEQWSEFCAMISEPLATTGSPGSSGQIEAAETLHRLIQTCYIGEAEFRTAAAVVEDDVMRRLFNSYSLQRARFAAELQSELARLADVELRPLHPRQSNPGVAVRADEALRACCRHSEALLVKYEEALKTKLPRSARFLASAQFALARQAHDRIQGVCARYLNPEHDNRTILAH